MAAEPIVRPFEPGDEAAVLRALERAAARGEPGVVSRDEASWRWRYLANPRGHRILLALSADGTVIHHQGGVPVAVRVADGPATRTSTWTRWSDTFLDREATHLGEEELFRAAAEPFHRRFGGPALDQAPVFYGTPARHIHRLGERLLGDEPVRDQNILVLFRDRFGEVRPGSVEVEERLGFVGLSEALDLLFERGAEGRAALCVRDGAFLRWRFDARPARTYRIGLARGPSGELAGYAVYRRAEAFGEAVGLICDWLTAPRDHSAASALRRWCVERAAADGAVCLGAVFPDTCPEWLEFQIAGFRVRPTPFFTVAHSFQRPYTASWLHSHWYYTLADFDYEATMLPHARLRVASLSSR